LEKVNLKLLKCSLLLFYFLLIRIALTKSTVEIVTNIAINLSQIYIFFEGTYHSEAQNPELESSYVENTGSGYV
jgi:hypothetical protein